MSFRDFPAHQEPLQLLQRSLDRGRLGHAYLFVGPHLAELEGIARTLAKTLNCSEPPSRGRSKLALDCCDRCPSCRQTDLEVHPEVHWVRPESKLRVITIDQIRDLIHTVNLRPTAAAWKVGVVVAADRLNVEAANAFLKTLEEPPPNSVLILLSTDADNIIETILSRCLRLNFGGESVRLEDAAVLEWLRQFTALAQTGQKTLLGRYHLLSIVLDRLEQLRQAITEDLTAKSPLQRYEEVEPGVRDRLQAELNAAIEAEYRRQRGELLTLLQWWLRDVWLQTMGMADELKTFPDLIDATRAVAGRLTPEQALANLHQIETTQRQLLTNVQEALALEVGLLSLNL